MSEKLTPMDRLVVVYIYIRQNTLETTAEVCNRLKMSESGFSKSRSKLEDLGFVKMTKNNGRGKAYDLTKKGESLICKMFQ